MAKNLSDTSKRKMMLLLDRFVDEVPDLGDPVKMKALLWLLDGVRPLPNMQLAVLLKNWQRRLSPYNPQELVLINGDPFETPPQNLRVLIRYRDQRDPFFPDSWHFPGGLLGSNERVEADTIQRVAKNEAGVGVSEIVTLCNVNFPKLERDHEYSTIHLCRMAKEPVLKLGITVVVPLGALPEKFLPHHIDMAERIKDWLWVMRRVEPELRKEIIRVHSVLESLSET